MSQNEKDVEENTCPFCGENYETEKQTAECTDNCAKQDANYWGSFS